MAATKFEKAAALFLLCSSLTLTLGTDSALRVQKENSQGHGTEKGNPKTELETTGGLRGENSLPDQSNFQIVSEDKQAGSDSSRGKFLELSSVSVNKQGSIFETKTSSISSTKSKGGNKNDEIKDALRPLGDDTQDKYETKNENLPQVDGQNRIPNVRKFEKTSRMIEVEKRRKQMLNVVARSLGLLKYKVRNYQHKFLLHVMRNRNRLLHRQNTLRTNMIRILSYIRRLHHLLHPPPAKIRSTFGRKMFDVEHRTNAVLRKYRKYLRRRKMYLKHEPKKHFIYKSLGSLASPPPQRRPFLFPRFRKPPDNTDVTVKRCPIFYHNLYAKILHKFLLRYRNVIHRLMSVLASRENHSTEKRDFFPEVVLRILQENFRSKLSYELKNRLNPLLKKSTNRLQIWRKFLTENRFFQRRLFIEFRRFKSPQRHVYCWRMWVVDKLLPLLNATTQPISNVSNDAAYTVNRREKTSTSFRDLRHKVFSLESTPLLQVKKSLATMYEYVYDKISGIFSVFKDTRNPSLRVSSVWRVFQNNTSGFKTRSSFNNPREYGFRYKSLEIFQRFSNYIQSLFQCFCRLKDKIVGYFAYVKDKFMKCLPSKTFFTETLSVSRLVRVCLEKYQKFLQDAMNELEKFKGKGKEQPGGKQNTSINSTQAPVKEGVQVLQKSQNSSDGLNPASMQESVDGLKGSKEEEERSDTKTELSDTKTERSDTFTGRSDTLSKRSNSKTGPVKDLKEIRLRDLLTNVVFKNVLRNRLKNKTSYAMGKTKEKKDKADENGEIPENSLSQFSKDRMRWWINKRLKRRRRDIAGVQHIKDQQQNKHGELAEKSTQISTVNKEVTDLKKSYLSQQAFALMKKMRAFRRFALWLLALPHRALALVRRVEAANLKLRMAMFDVFIRDKIKKLDSKSNEETQGEKRDDDDSFEEWKAQYYDETTHKILVNLKKQFMKKPNSDDETVDDKNKDETSKTATPKSSFLLKISVKKNTNTTSTLKDLLTKDVNKPTVVSVPKQNEPSLISRRRRSALKNTEPSNSKPDSVNNLQAKLKELTEILDSNFKTSTESSERNNNDDDGDMGQPITNDNSGDSDKSEHSDDDEVKLTELTRHRAPSGSHIKKDGSGDYVVNLGNNKLRKLHAAKLDTADQMKSKLMDVLNSVRENEKTGLEKILSQTSGLRKNYMKGQSAFQQRKDDIESYGNHSSSVFDDFNAIEEIKEQIQQEYEDDGENSDIEESALSSTVLFPPKPDGQHPSYDDYKLLKNIEKLAYNFLKDNGKTKKGKNKFNTGAVDSLGNPDAKVFRSKRAVDVDEAVIGDTKPNDFVEEWSKLRGQAQKLAKSVNKAKNKYEEASGEIENIMKQGDDLKNKIVLNVGDSKPNQAVVQENWGKIKQEFEDFQKDVERKENVAAEDKAQFLGREEVALLKLEDAANEHSDVQDPEINEIFSSVHLGTERLAPALGAMEYNRNMLDQTGDPDDLTNLEDPAGGIYREPELGDESPIPNFDYSGSDRFLSEDINDMTDDMELMTEYEYDIDSHADPQLENLDSMLQSMRSKVRVIREAKPPCDCDTDETKKENNSSSQKNQIHDQQVDTKSIIGAVHESSIQTKHNGTVRELSEPTEHKGNDSDTSLPTAHKGTVPESSIPTERKINVVDLSKPSAYKGNDSETSLPTAHEGTVPELSKPIAKNGTVPESAIETENKRNDTESLKPTEQKGNDSDTSLPTAHEGTVPESSIPTEEKMNVVELSKPSAHKGNDTESLKPTEHKGTVPELSKLTANKGTVPESAIVTENKEHKGNDGESSKQTAHEGTVPETTLPTAHEGTVPESSTPTEEKMNVVELSKPSAHKGNDSETTLSTAHEGTVPESSTTTERKMNVVELAKPSAHKGNDTESSLTTAHKGNDTKSSLRTAHKGTVPESSLPTAHKVIVPQSAIATENKGNDTESSLPTAHKVIVPQSAIATENKGNGTESLKNKGNDTESLKNTEHKGTVPELSKPIAKNGTVPESAIEIENKGNDTESLKPTEHKGNDGESSKQTAHNETVPELSIPTEQKMNAVVSSKPTAHKGNDSKTTLTTAHEGTVPESSIPTEEKVNVDELSNFSAHKGTVPESAIVTENKVTVPELSKPAEHTRNDSKSSLPTAHKGIVPQSAIATENEGIASESSKSTTHEGTEPESSISTERKGNVVESSKSTEHKVNDSELSKLTAHKGTVPKSSKPIEHIVTLPESAITTEHKGNDTDSSKQTAHKGIDTELSKPTEHKRNDSETSLPTAHKVIVPESATATENKRNDTVSLKTTKHKGNDGESSKQTADKMTVPESSIPTERKMNVDVSSKPTAHKENDSETTLPTAHEGTVPESSIPTEEKVNVDVSSKATEHKENNSETTLPTAHEGTVPESSIPTEEKINVVELSKPSAHKGNDTESSLPTAHEGIVPESSLPTAHEGIVPESSITTERKMNVIESSKHTEHKGTVPESAITIENKVGVSTSTLPTANEEKVQNTSLPIETVSEPSKPTPHKDTESALTAEHEGSVQNTTLPEVDKGSVPGSSLPTLHKESVQKSPQPRLRNAITQKTPKATLRKGSVQKKPQPRLRNASFGKKKQARLRKKKKKKQPKYLKHNGTLPSPKEESDAHFRIISAPEPSAPEITSQTVGSSNDEKKKQNSSSDITSPALHPSRHNITKRQAEADARIKQLSLDDATEEEVKEDANFDQLFPKEHYDANEYRYDQYYDFNDDDTDLDKDETLNVPPSVGDVAADISGKTLLYDIGGMEYDKDTTINELSNLERHDKMDVLDKDGDSSLKNLEEFNRQPQTIDKAMKDVHRASDFADLPNPLGLNEKDDVRAIGQRHGIETDVEREVLDRGLPLGSNSDIDNEISEIGKEKLDDGIEDEDFNADFPEIDDISPFTNAIKDQMGDYTDLEVPKEELPELLHTQLGRVEKARINGIRTEAWKDSYDIVEKTKKVRLKEEHLYQKDMMEFEKINRGLNRTLQELDNMTNQLEEAMNHQVMETLKPHVDNDKEILGFELSTISPNLTLQLKLLEAKWNILSEEKRKGALKEAMLDNKKIKKPIKILRNEKTLKVMMDGNKPGLKVGLKSITTRYNNYRRKSHPPLEISKPDDFGKIEKNPDKFLIRQFKNGNVQGRVKLRHWGDKVGGRTKPVNFGTEVVGTWEREPEGNANPASKTEDGPVGDSPKPKTKQGAGVPKMKSITKKTTSYIVDESDQKDELKGGKKYNTNRPGGHAQIGEDTRDSREQGHVIQKREVDWLMKTRDSRLQKREVNWPMKTRDSRLQKREVDWPMKTRDSREQGHVIQKREVDWLMKTRDSRLQKREVNWPVKTGEEDVDYEMLAKSNVDDDHDDGERQELADESLLEVAESPDKSQIFTTPKEKVDDIAFDVIPTDSLVDVKEAARHFKEEEEMADFVLPPTLTEADEKFVMENGIDKNDPDNYKKAEDQTDNDIEIENIGDPFLAEEGVVSEIRDMQEADDIDEEISSAVESLEKESVGDLQNVQKDVPEVEDVSTGERLANIAFDNDRTLDRTFQQFKDLEEDRVKALEDHVQRERDETLDDVRLEQIGIKKEAGNVLEDSEYMAEAVEDVERYSDKMDKDNLIVLSQD